jgi:hypothetical protein
MPAKFTVHRRRSVLLAIIILAFGAPHRLLAQAPRAAKPPEGEAQWWKGSFEVGGAKTDFVVVFRAAGQAGQYAATIDIPVQGAKDLALTDVVLTATELRFALPPPPGAAATAKAVFELKRDADGKAASGTLKQHGLTLPTHMERVTEDEARAVGPPRPQTPKPPFPYTQREVTYENPVDQTKLAGTLTIPQGAGPHPAVILITGSGAQDRDETIFGHKPFLIIADHLTRRGIAVLRVDDRGVGGSSGSTAESTTKSFANDVISGLKFLKKQPEIDPQRIGLVGHSEGGVIAPLVASKSKDVACIVLLAGSAIPGDKLLGIQLAALSRAAGMPADLVEKQTTAQQRIFELMAQDADEAALRGAVRELVKLQLAEGSKPDDAAQLDAATEAGVKQLSAPWMRFFLKYDPRDALRKVKCPVLALNGSLDLQVPPKDNLPEIERALREAGNGDVTVKELLGLNHLFQEAKTGLVLEYATIEQTIAPVALDEIATWLRARFKLTP